MTATNMCYNFVGFGCSPPLVEKLSHVLQTKHLDLSLISSLMDATHNSLDNAILPSANWVLPLQDAREELKAATVLKSLI